MLTEIGGGAGCPPPQPLRIVAARYAAAGRAIRVFFSSMRTPNSLHCPNFARTSASFRRMHPRSDVTGRLVLVFEGDPSRLNSDHSRKKRVVGELQRFLYHSDFPRITVENDRQHRSPYQLARLVELERRGARTIRIYGVRSSKSLVGKTSTHASGLCPGNIARRFQSRSADCGDGHWPRGKNDDSSKREAKVSGASPERALPGSGGRSNSHKSNQKKCAANDVENCSSHMCSPEIYSGWISRRAPSIAEHSSQNAVVWS